MSISASGPRADSILFSPISVGSTEIPNRFVRSATHDFLAEDSGAVTDRQIDLFSRLAEGEVGLIITGHAFVSLEGRASPRQIGIQEDGMIEGLARLALAAHGFASKIFVQLAHAGRQTKEKITGATPVAPSAVFEPVYKTTPREMTGADIRQTIRDFVTGAMRAHRAGFDGVELHAAHGYLLSSFLSPHANRRSDEWGGSIRNRTRIVSEIVRGIKNDAGGSFPVIAKMNSSDLMTGGLEVEEAVEAAAILQADGLDGIEVSGGTSESGRGSMWPGIRPEEDEGYFVDSAARFKSVLRIAVIGLGGFRTFRAMERAILVGRADLVSLARPLIREPWLVRKFRAGEASVSECVSCNKCLNPRGLSCSELRVPARHGSGT